MINHKVSSLLNFVYDKLSSTKVFILALTLLVFQSAWLVFSAIYPLPFDEYYHVGLIKMYAQQWSPFITEQSEAASLYGDITRAPSYLYHYLMSFPYRIFDIFIDSETILIILMRIINVAFVVIAIILFRNLFLKAGISKRLINVAVLFFVITPIVPFLAAHVNYDNLMLLLTPIVVGSAYAMYRNKRLDAVNLAIFLSVGAATVMVKNSFLPILAGLGIGTIACVALSEKNNILKGLLTSWQPLAVVRKILIITAVIASLLIVGERYGYNIIRYKSLWPRCEAVQSEEVCKNYMPWYRNNQDRQNPIEDATFGNPISFTQHWVSKMTRGYFAIFSHTPTKVLVWYEPFGPIVLRSLMPVPIVTAIVSVGASLGMVVINAKKIFANKFWQLMGFVAAGYLLFLWNYNYLGYLDSGYAQGIQARYTYPVLLPGILLLCASWSFIKLRDVHKSALIIAIFLVFLWGGGIAGWIIRSDSLWYWQNSYVESINQKTQSILKKVIWH